MKKKKNSSFVVIALLLIVTISIGYAALSTTLNINGTSTIKTQTWDVHFANVKSNNYYWCNSNKSTNDY